MGNRIIARCICLLLVSPSSWLQNKPAGDWNDSFFLIMAVHFQLVGSYKKTLDVNSPVGCFIFYTSTPLCRKCIVFSKCDRACLMVLSSQVASAGRSCCSYLFTAPCCLFSPETGSNPPRRHTSCGS